MSIYDAKDFHVRHCPQTAHNTVANTDGTNIEKFSNYPLSYDVKNNKARDFNISGLGKLAPSSVFSGVETCAGTFNYYLSFEDGLENQINQNYMTGSTGADATINNQTIKTKTYKNFDNNPNFGWTANIQYKKGDDDHTVFQKDLFLTSRTYTISSENPIINVSTEWIGGKETALNSGTEPIDGSSNNTADFRTIVPGMELIFEVDGTAYDYKEITITQTTGIKLAYNAAGVVSGVTQDVADMKTILSVTQYKTTNNTILAAVKANNNPSVKIKTDSLDGNNTLIKRLWSIQLPKTSTDTDGFTLVNNNGNEIVYTFQALVDDNGESVIQQNFDSLVIN